VRRCRQLTDEWPGRAFALSGLRAEEQRAATVAGVQPEHLVVGRRVDESGGIVRQRWGRQGDRHHIRVADSVGQICRQVWHRCESLDRSRYGDATCGANLVKPSR
jgi:hypothetical protein